MLSADTEFSDEMFIVTKETAEDYVKAKATMPKPPEPASVPPKPGEPAKPAEQPVAKPEQLTIPGMEWTGEIPPQKWMNFYTKVLSKFAAARGLKLELKVEVKPEGGISKQKLEETKAALRELGLNDDIEPK